MAEHTTTDAAAARLPSSRAAITGQASKNSSPDVPEEKNSHTEKPYINAISVLARTR